MNKTVVRFTLIFTMALLSCFYLGTAMADTLTLPADLQIIEAEAFYGDTSISDVVLSNHIVEIRSKAFANSSLTNINLPASLSFIAEDALPSPDQVHVTAHEGSYAFDWAVTHGYLLSAPVQNASQGKNREIIVSWTAVDGVDTYNIYYSTTSDISDATVKTGITGNKCTIDQLQQGTTYYTWVKAVGQKGVSAASNMQSVITYPAAPTLNEPVVSGNSISFTWNAVPGASLYRLNYSTIDDFDTSTRIDNIKTTACTVEGLAYNTTYYFWPESANASGGLRKTSSVSATTGPDPAAPVQHALEVYMRQITVSWDASADAQSYRVYYGTTDDISAAAEITGITATSYVLKNLEAGTTYYTWVKAVTAAGVGNASNMEHVITYPSAPVLNTPVVSGNTISLSWNDVKSADRYSIRYGTTNVFNNSNRINNIRLNSHTIEGLEFNTKYYIWMESYNESGGVKTANPIEVTTEDDALTPKQNDPKGGQKKITVSWTAVDSAESYCVYYGTTATFSAAEKISAVTGSSYTITGLAAGTRYYTWVTAVSDGVESNQSNRKSALTLPPAASIETIDVTGNSITVTWKATTSATGYYLKYGTSSDYNAAQGTTETTAGTSCTIIGLDYDTTYYVWIVTKNASGSIRSAAPKTAMTEAN